MVLHPNAAIRVLRAEDVRLAEAQGKLAELIDHPRVDQEMIRRQIRQCDAEMGEIVDAIMLVESHHEADQGQLPFDFDVAGRAGFVAA